MIPITSNYGAMLALVGALACGGSNAQELCKYDYLPAQGASASSVESNHFVAAWAVDTDPNSRWASDGPGADGASEEQWLEIDLGGVRFIDSIIIEWERAHSKAYEVKVSDLGVTWVPVFTDPSARGGSVELTMLDVRARFVRIASSRGDPNYGISIYEVKLFGDSDGVNCLQPTTCRQTAIGDLFAVASSEESSHFGAGKAVDGDSSTRWSSEFRDGESITVDLGALTLVNSVWLFWERAYAGSYKLESGDSLLEGPWHLILEETDSDGEVDIHGDLHPVTRYLRLLSTDRATRYGNSLWEFQVRGTQNGDCSGTCVAGSYQGGNAIITQTGGELVVDWAGSRPDATGAITAVNDDYIIGYMNFPDDVQSPYTLNLRIADNKIYWNGLMGNTGNIWTRDSALDCT
jgi:hypothetical protein